MRNKIFALNRENQLMRTRAEPHISFLFERSIVYFDPGRLLGSDWNGDRFAMNNNLYFEARTPDIRFAGKSFEEWKAPGHDAKSIVRRPAVRQPRELRFPPAPRLARAEDGFRADRHDHGWTANAGRAVAARAILLLSPPATIVFVKHWISERRPT